MRPHFLIGRAGPRSVLVLAVALALLGSVLAVVVSLRPGPGDGTTKVQAVKPPRTTVAPDAVDTPGPHVPDTAHERSGDEAAFVGGRSSASGAQPVAAERTSPGDPPPQDRRPAPWPHTPVTPAPAPVAPAPVAPDPPPSVDYPSGPGDPLTLGQLYVVSLATGTPHSVAAHADLFDRAEWSHDGRRLLYGVDSPPDPLTFTITPNRRARGMLPGGGIEPPTWSRRGDLARVEYDGVAHNLKINPGGGGVRRILARDVGPVTGRQWSPDGLRLGVIAGGRVYTANPDGTGVTPITPSSVRAWKWMQWSPDGTRIAFYGANRLWVVNADGTNLLDLAPANADPGFSWSPDSKELAVVGPFHDTPQLGISVVPATGGTPRPLGVSGIEVAWSPDGTTIAYTSWPRVQNTNPLALVAPDGTNKRTLLHPPSRVYFGLGIDWSPDSTHLLLNTGRGKSGAGEPG